MLFHLLNYIQYHADGTEIEINLKIQPTRSLLKCKSIFFLILWIAYLEIKSFETSINCPLMQFLRFFPTDLVHKRFSQYCPQNCPKIVHIIVLEIALEIGLEMVPKIVHLSLSVSNSNVSLSSLILSTNVSATISQNCPRNCPQNCPLKFNWIISWKISF